MLLHGQTGCDQANGLLVLVCIYLYGVNCEPPLKGCVASKHLRLWRHGFHQHPHTIGFEVLSLSPPSLLGERSLELCSKEVFRAQLCAEVAE